MTKLATRHPIAVAAERTGLSQDVLRVWERRYGAVSPDRSEGGQRLYSDADIARLRLLHTLTRAGRSISQIAELDTDALTALADADSSAREVRDGVASPEAGAAVDAALELIRQLDVARLEEALRRSSAVLGLSAFLEEVAAPLLRRVGDEWHAGRMTPAQEHLASAAVHDIIIETMRGFTPREDAQRVLIATPAGERHVIGAAIAGAIAAAEGWRVMYLGADLPADDIATTAVAAGVRCVALSVVYVVDREKLMHELRALRAQLPAEITLLAGGAGARQLEPALSKLGVQVVAGAAGMQAALRKLSA